MTDDYVKGYNEALADVRFNTTRWATVTLREHGEPYLSRETSKHINKLCASLRKSNEEVAHNNEEGSVVRVRAKSFW